MRLVIVKAPEGHGNNIAELAVAAGADQVSLRQARQFKSGNQESTLDVVEVETATPRAKHFIERLLEAPFYNPDTYAFTTIHPESLLAGGTPEEDSHPMPRPTPDVYEELWQFSKITIGLLGRVFLSSTLLAYGMVEDLLPLILAGLLFLPFHHHMLTVGLGVVLREWHFLWQGVLALLASTLMILLAGVCVALFTEPPVAFEEFGTPLTGMLLSAVIGAAAALGAVDDAGRRELIGLAATAHISVYPAWFGLKLIFGLDAGDNWEEHLLTFGVNVLSLTLIAGITFAVMQMRGGGVRRYVSKRTGTA
ncbi:MAG: hypothetical protein LPK03_08275 [Pontibacter sp.]|nr:hypothetical protein [Pontibacter sp.]